MIRRPPRSTRTDTLFPYPTLFRSDGAAVAAAPAGGRGPLTPRHDEAAPLATEARGAEVCAGWCYREQLRHGRRGVHLRSEEHTSELQSLMRISYAVFCLKKKKK